MAHECPECSTTCHCGGDIDDICFSGTKYEMMCQHCEDGEDDDHDPCPKCGEYGGHESSCPLRNPLYDKM